VVSKCSNLVQAGLTWASVIAQATGRVSPIVVRASGQVRRLIGVHGIMRPQGTEGVGTQAWAVGACIVGAACVEAVADDDLT
jgi:hypothetical protein